MTAVWIGILVLAFSWLKALPLFEDAGGSLPWFLVGVLLVVFGLRNQNFWQDGPRKGPAVAVLVSSMVAIAWLGDPFRTGFLLLALAALLTLLPVPRAAARWALPGLWFSGMVCVLQAACVPLLYSFCARYHQTAELPFLHDLVSGFPSFPWLATLLYVPLKILNPDTALGGATLYMPASVDVIALTPTWEKLGLIPAVLFGAGAAPLLLLRPDWRRRLGGLLFWTALFLYVRLVLLFLLVAHTRNERAFWLFDFVFLSFFPLALLLAAWWHRGSSAPESPEPSEVGPLRSGRKRFLAWLAGPEESESHFDARLRTARVLVATFLFAGGLTAFWGFHDAGIPKAGRILIDEGHSDWEWTTEPFDTLTYGGKSGYNYYCLADYWNHFYSVETRRDSLTSELLAGWDVLVIKTPTSAFSKQEVDAIEGFVRQGGGLFLIGDHTNVFGTSTYLNAIAERFGMYFRYDATYTLASLGLSLFERPHRFAHPVIRFMPDYLFATSCTMYSPPLSENVILGYGLRAMYLDYSEVSYFPTKQEKWDYDFGLFVQAGGVRFGKGRVLGFTDSTCFSNFFMFMPGKPELALASLEWLNRTNRWSWRYRIFLLTSLIGLVLLVIEARRNTGLSFWQGVIVSGTLTVVVLGAITESQVARSYALPQPHRPPIYITFDHEHGNYLIPAETLPVSNWQNFQTFYVWTQRMGLVPRDESSLEGAVRNSRALVEIHPYRSFSIEEIDLVVDFVRRGGTLVVLDSPDNFRSSAKTLLGPFSVYFDGEVADSLAVLDAQGDTLGVPRRAVGVRGVAPLLTLGDGRTVMGYRPFGKGRVVACGASYLFCSESMGNTAVVPNARQRRVFRAEYDVFEKVAGLRVRGRYYLPDE
ncbi:MAG: hypothetical protein JSW03_09750 [Candidatus Eiseniibacteriota bacterium]|nr:MAG: hypothetical protein JSW03_09750 [Candidatus Eisenbacteria bacterium]